MSTSGLFLEDLREQNRAKRQRSDRQRDDLIQQYTTLRDQAQKVLTSGQAFDKATGNMRPLTDQEKQQLTETTTHLTNYIQRLFNPSVDVTSGQLQEDPIHKLTTKLRITRAPQGAPPGETAPEIAKSAAGFQTQFGETPETAGALARQETERKITQFEDLAKKYNLPEQVKTDIIGRMLGAPGAITRAKWDTLSGTVDGKRVTWMKNQASGEITDLAGNEIPPDVATRFVADPKSQAHETRLDTSKEAYGDSFDPPVTWDQMTPQQKAFFPRWEKMQGEAITTGQHVTMVLQPDNSYKPVTVQTTSQRAFPSSAPGVPPVPPGLRTGGGGAPSAAPAAPAKPKAAPKGGGAPGGPVPPAQRVNPKGAGVVSIGAAVGGKPEKDLTESIANWRGAVDRAKTMHANWEDVKKAAKEGRTDQQAMLSLLFNHIGMTSGAQKGTRITQTMIDEAQSSAPLVARLLAAIGIDNMLDDGSLTRAMNGVLGGVKLTGEQMESMVHLADEKVKILREHADEAERFARERMEGPAPSEGKKTKGRRSLKAAMDLPINKGKSEAEVIKDLEKHDYEVVRP